MPRRRKTLRVLPFCIVALLARGESGAPSVEPAQLWQRMAEMDSWRTAALQEYEVTRRYILHAAHSRSVAEMGVRMNYRYPGQKRFEIVWSKGSSAVRSRVFNRVIAAEIEAAQDPIREQVRISSRNYDFRLIGADVQEGRPAYVLELIPKFRNKYLVHGRIWVDMQDYAIARIEGSPAEKVSFWVRRVHIVQTYRKIGDFWLVASNQTDTEVRLFGSARLNIEYFDYRINGTPVDTQVSLR